MQCRQEFLELELMKTVSIKHNMALSSAWRQISSISSFTNETTDETSEGWWRQFPIVKSLSALITRLSFKEHRAMFNGKMPLKYTRYVNLLLCSKYIYIYIYIYIFVQHIYFSYDHFRKSRPLWIYIGPDR